MRHLCGDYLDVEVAMDEKSQLTLNIGIGGDKFSEIKDLSKSALSSGQKQRVDLSLMLAMSHFLSQRFRVQFNALFFDEIFNHLDNEAQSHVLQLMPVLLSHQKSGKGRQGQGELLEFSRALSSIFIISHNKDIEGPWNYDYVVRENGSSSVHVSDSPKDAAGVA